MLVEILALVLVFVAVTWIVWVVTPVLAQIGLERTIGRYAKPEAGRQLGPLYRFTTPERLAQARISAALLGLGIICAILISFNVLTPWILILVGGLAALLCFQIPRWWVGYCINKRRRLFEVKLTDLTLGLANGLRAGAALPQSLEVVSRDLGGPMTEELSLVLHEYRLGIDLPESLNRLCERMPSEDLSLLVTAIRLTMQSGGSLAEVLDRITDTIRERTEFQERLRTMTAQGRFEAIAMAAAPAVAFLILFFLDRELMRPLVETRIGWCAIAAVAFLETVGFIIINKIVTIDV